MRTLLRPPTKKCECWRDARCTNASPHESLLEIGTAAGIGIYLHVTFMVLLGWIGLSHYLQRQRWEDAVAGLGFISALF